MTALTLHAMDEDLATALCRHAGIADQDVRCRAQNLIVDVVLRKLIVFTAQLLTLVESVVQRLLNIQLSAQH